MSNDELKTRKITVDLPQKTIDTLKKLANEQGITATAALRKAISTEEFLREEINKDAKILIQESNGTTNEVIFR